MKLLIEKEYLLQKIEGKGGWTYAEIPEILKGKNTPFGWVRVRGFIDDFEIKGYNLMPLGNGNLFLPIKAEIRKKIKKQAGDTVKVVLFEDNLPTEVPEEMLDCLRDEPKLLDIFMKFTDAERKGFVTWIYSAKTDETKINRMAQMLDMVAKNLTLTSRVK